MRHTQRLLLSCGFLLVLAGSGSQADAYGPWGPWGPWYQFGGYQSYFYRLDPINGRPPYYAEFPPVYYSHPVARPYGVYPYPYMPMPPRPPMPGPRPPRPVHEGRMQPKVEPDQGEIAGTVEPEVIINPFVEAVGSDSEARLAADSN